MHRFALLLVLVSGCSEDRRPPSGGSSSYSATGGEPPPFTPIAKDSGVPLCSVPRDTVCDCVDLPVLGEPPNIYMVLDHSGSMQRDNLWSNSVAVTLDMMKKIGSRANYGAALFPSLAGDTCSPGAEIMSMRRGDAPGSFGATLQYFSTQTLASAPSGGTPTAATLRALTPTITALPGKTFVVLATDGGPNCNENNLCDSTRCQPNIESYPGCEPNGANCCAKSPGACLDDIETKRAVQTLKARGVPTYVLGVPGSAPYAALLNEMASLGGTAKLGADKYYRVDSADKQALGKALAQVAAKIVATCTLSLKDVPADKDKVNVYLDEVALPREPVNGWKLEGKEVTLVGQSCERVLAGDVLDVRVIAGCPTVEPK
jgi:hypothetical protein